MCVLCLTIKAILSIRLNFCSPFFFVFLNSHIVVLLGGNTGKRLYDFFIGRELNPRLGRFDLKEFCELYPGLIGWVVIDLAMAYKQYESLGYVTNSMLLVCWFHGMYVADALYYEKVSHSSFFVL